MFSSFTRSFKLGRRASNFYGYDTTRASFFISANFDESDEGTTVTFTLSTVNVADGIFVPYVVSGTGISQSDFTSGSLTGNFIINSNSATVSFTINADALGEGDEIMILSLKNHPSITKSLTINDTSVWTPSEDPSLIGWYDASDSSTVTLNSSNRVISLDPKQVSGTSYGVTMFPTKVDRAPYYVGGAINFYPESSPGAADNSNLVAPGNTWPGTDGNYIVVGLTDINLNSNGDASLWSFEDRTSPFEDVRLKSNTSSGFDGAFEFRNVTGSAVSTYAFSGGSFTGNQIHSSLFDATNNVVNARMNGVSKLTTKAYSGIIKNSFDFWISSNRGGVDTTLGAFREIVILNSNSASLVQKVEGYLAHKWGLVGLLPSTHPYKTTAP